MDRLKLHVAAAVVAAQLTPLEDEVELLVIVADIVSCWLKLSPETQDQYNELPAATGVTHFACDYTMAVDRACIIAEGLPDAEVERMRLINWKLHTARLIARHGEPGQQQFNQSLLS